MKLLRQNIRYVSSSGIKSEFDSSNWSKFNNAEIYLNDYEKKVSNKHLRENWFECGQTKNLSVSFSYAYYPAFLLDWDDKHYSPTVNYLKQFDVLSSDFDCELFQPDIINLKIEIGPCLFMLYATFLKCLWYVKVRLDL